jgi:DUF1680 family protein
MNSMTTSLSHPSPLTPVPFTSVRIEDAFWAPRIETNRRVTVPTCLDKCEETGRIANFARAGGLEDGPFQGCPFDDSDVYKLLEGVVYSLANHPDPALEAQLEDVVRKIAAAQQPNGYLYTADTLGARPLHPMAGPERWSNVQFSHELYNAGHLFEAAAAYYQLTGRRALLDVAVRFADLIDSVFGPDKRHDAPGHQEIEIGLMRLYNVTGEERYLKLARFFLDERGHDCGRKLYGEYAQDHKPVAAQEEAVGHAVRAVYMYCAMTDVALMSRNEPFEAALDRLWADVTGRKMYLTGGVGARHEGEAFGKPFELPNDTAYCETCAAIAFAMWNLRMGLLHADGRYADAMERVIYNGFLSGVSLSGDRFFYPNPLAGDGTYHRSPWFGCSCCPVNVARFLPSLGGYIYAAAPGALYVNLYIGGQAEANIDGTSVGLEMRTRYPWEGAVKLTVRPERETAFALRLRVPAWCAGASVKVNGAAQAAAVQRGYLTLERSWRAGDTVELELPLEARWTACDPRVEANRGRVALERGPLVYCFEDADNPAGVRPLAVKPDAPVQAAFAPELLGGVLTLSGQGTAAEATADTLYAPMRTGQPSVWRAIPYYAWDNREAGAMAVWMPLER